MEMRAKMKVMAVTDHADTAGNVVAQTLAFSAVGKKEVYDSTGNDENNTYAKWTP